MKNCHIWVYLEWETTLYFWTFFWRSKILLNTLTYSAMGYWTFPYRLNRMGPLALCLCLCNICLWYMFVTNIFHLIQCSPTNSISQVPQSTLWVPGRPTWWRTPSSLLEAFPPGCLIDPNSELVHFITAFYWKFLIISKVSECGHQPFHYFSNFLYVFPKKLYLCQILEIHLRPTSPL